MIKLTDILSEIKVSIPYPPKTIGWWLNQLEEPYRSQALNNFKRYNRNGNKIVDNLHYAINQAFMWEETPEGKIYWFRLYQDNLSQQDYLQEIKINPPKNSGWYHDVNRMTDVRVQQAWVDYYTNKIDGKKLKQIILFICKNMMVEDGFIQYINNYNDGSSEESLPPSSSGSFLTGFYDFDFETDDLSEEEQDLLKDRMEEAYYSILYKIKNNKGINEIKVNKPFKPPTHFPITVTKKEYPQVTEYLTKMGYKWTGETYTDFNKWNPWDNGGVEDEESKIYLFLKNKNIIYWGYVDNIVVRELNPTPIKNFNKVNENQQIKNINYYQQILDQSNGLSITQRQYFQKIINSIKKQNNIVTPRQHDLLQRIKSGNFTYSTKNEIKVNNPNKIRTTWYEEDGLYDIHFGFNIDEYNYYTHIDNNKPDEVNVFIHIDAFSGKNEYNNLIKYLDKRNIKYNIDEDEDALFVTLDKDNFNIIK